MQLPSMIFTSFLAGGAYAFQFQAYSDNNYHGRVKNYDTSGIHKPGFTIKSYRWDSPSRDGCCVKMCDGGSQVGYWCPSKSNGRPSRTFNKVIMALDIAGHSL
ncbi:hypothetical protein V496_00138 [Pseudogymnoascus sp. VKM F-4515 (FW-2607)]|nr:hypothetical protein V496_00138 [Pseudogymnoascus sp. VKM F-4515 (FW-2607)]